jgi:uncharacterized protein
MGLLASTFICGSACSQTNAGKPTFDCARANSSMAQTICKTPSAIQADWSLTTSYWAAYFSTAANDRQRFADSHAAWFKSLERDCFQPANNSQASQCITQNYQARAEIYRKSLSGDALIEASLSPETLIGLQNSLFSMGFLSSDGACFGGLSRRKRTNRTFERSFPPGATSDSSARRSSGGRWHYRRHARPSVSDGRATERRCNVQPRTLSIPPVLPRTAYRQSAVFPDASAT